MSEHLDIRDIDLRDIGMPKTRLRKLRPDVVTALATSLKNQGLLQPIVIRAAGDRGLKGDRPWLLVAGVHRLRAAEQLGWETIPSRVVAIGNEPDLALLAEIEENLARADLSPAERAAHEAKRQQIYERQFPETKHGKNPKRGRVAKFATLPSSAKARAKATGKSARTIRLDVARGKAIPKVEELADTSLDKGEELDALARLPPELQDDLMNKAIGGEKVSAIRVEKRERRKTLEKELGEYQQALPDKHYGVIAADPPWRFKPWSSETGMDRAADNHYPTMTLDEISALPIAGLAAADAVLLLWATSPMLDDALAVMAAWGFTYKTNFVWAKAKKPEDWDSGKAGTGFWLRAKHEILLLGTVGNPPAPAPGTQWDSVQWELPRKHSQKPEWFYRMVAEYFPTLPKIEVFARGPAREGWEVWGNETANGDEG